MSVRLPILDPLPNPNLTLILPPLYSRLSHDFTRLPCIGIVAVGSFGTVIGSNKFEPISSPGHRQSGLRTHARSRTAARVTALIYH